MLAFSSAITRGRAPLPRSSTTPSPEALSGPSASTAGRCPNWPLDEARKRLREGAKEALQKRSQVAAFRLNPPLTFELELNTSAQAELPTLIYLVKRTNPRTVEFSSDDYLKGFKLLRALIGLAGIS